jgi:hypothetical protein
MLKSRFAMTIVLLALLVALAPAPSQAAPRGWTAVSVPSVSSLFEKIARWWNQTVTGLERRQTSTSPKLGCGIDPNGSPVCGSDPDPLTASQPGDPEGSGSN